MAVVTSTLDEIRTELHERFSQLTEKLEPALRKEVLSVEFITSQNDTKVLDALTQFQNGLFGLVGEIQRPVQGLPETKATLNPEEETSTSEFQPRRSFDFPLAGVMGIGLIVCLFLAFYQFIPGMIPVYLFLICLGVAFAGPISGFIRGLLMKKEEKAEMLEDWLVKKFEMLRNEFSGSEDMVLFQPQTKEDLEHLERSGMDPELFETAKSRRSDLRLKFLNVMAEAMVFTEKNIWHRDEVVIAAMSSSQQSAAARAA